MRMGSTHFLMKRLPKVATEMALHVLAFSIGNTRVASRVAGQGRLVDASWNRARHVGVDGPEPHSGCSLGCRAILGELARPCSRRLFPRLIDRMAAPTRGSSSRTSMWRFIR